MERRPHLGSSRNELPKWEGTSISLQPGRKSALARVEWASKEKGLSKEWKESEGTFSVREDLSFQRGRNERGKRPKRPR